MRNNETGEFELVVGNKQLLSGFFIVVLLFAVAFAMGYVVGQNSPRSAKLTETTAAPPVVTSTADSRPQPSTPPAPVPAAAPAPTGEQPPADGPPQPTTQAAQSTAPAVTDKPAGKAGDAPSASNIVAASDLPAGNFWQVLAVKSDVTEAVVQSLHGKGFAVILTPGTSNLTRVLVGPYNDAQTMGRAKTDLENAGFRPVRYKRD
jgi:cell division protein FtsN